MKTGPICAPGGTTFAAIGGCFKPNSRKLERQYIERRLNEEKSAMERLTSSPQQF